MRRALLAFFVLALAVPAGASAAEIKDVDTSGHPTLRFTYIADAESSSPPTVEENGEFVTGLQAANLGRAKSLVVAIDRSQSMTGKPLADAITAARSFIAAKPPEDRVAVATFATKSVLLTGFSTATIDADGALRTIAIDPVQGTTLYDSVVASSNALAGEALPGRVLLVVTDGNETLSEASLEDALAAAKNAGVAIYIVGIESSKFNPDPLHRLADETGGSYYGTASTGALTEVYTSIAEELKRTWQVEYMTRARPLDEIALKVTTPGSTPAAMTFKLPAVAGANLPAADKPSALLPEFFYTSDWGAPLLAGVVGLLVLLAAALAFASPRGSWLKGRLEPHVAPARNQVLRQRRQTQRFLFLRGLFGATESAFGNFRHFRRLERVLERGDLPLKAGEFVWIMAGAGFMIAFLHGVFFKAAWSLPLGFAEGAAIPYAVVAYKARKRLKAFENQLPDILVTMAASLKAGHSFRQGMQSVVDEGQEPASKEFKRVLTETQLGRSMDDALADMALRVGSKNFEFVMSSVTIQRQVGGSLAGLFDMVADTVRQRHQFQRKIRGLTAMGRMSAYVLVGLPFLVFLAIFAINQDYIDPLLSTSTGNKLLMIGAVMMALGSAFLKKIVSFKG